MSTSSALLVALVIMAVSCSDGTSSGTATSSARARGGDGDGPTAARTERAVYVAVGASDSVGYGADDPARDAWPRVLHRTALPPGTELVNLGIPGATVGTALSQELPEALRRAPTLATVWLNVNDILASVPVATYERQLAQLVGALRRGGRTRVLVANTPPLDRLPVYQACLARPECLGGALPGPAVVEAAVDAYNAAIDRVVTAAGAELVDLYATGEAAQAAGTDAELVGDDGFHPSTAGHRAVAAAFAAVLARS